eukprot:CAMPEP_0176486922 /NCGR_PEP_ID=MMETSP0200_2-20121128/5838_1 /TAXON_ID=947934 /ORGANISM="Chaetoceros sp., Strain GSL56" /LENGTH=74 /DNA_ID=CAMNT_0017883679 /DNA_START=822 /DNA_END=1046 /DNA_ORIENTATION=-
MKLEEREYWRQQEEWEEKLFATSNNGKTSELNRKHHHTSSISEKADLNGHVYWEFKVLIACLLIPRLRQEVVDH